MIDEEHRKRRAAFTKDDRGTVHNLMQRSIRHILGESQVKDALNRLDRRRW